MKFFFHVAWFMFGSLSIAFQQYNIGRQSSKWSRGRGGVNKICSPTRMTLGDYVTVDLEADIGGGKTFEIPYDQGLVRFVINGGGYTREIHSTINDMNVGEAKEISVNGGDYYKELAADIPKAKVPSGLSVGDILRLSNGLKALVTAVSKDSIRIDANPPLAGTKYNVNMKLIDRKPLDYLEEVVLGAGCFWGVELAFQRLPGVCYTAVGYTHGTVTNPSYEDVCTGTTGHVEAVKVLFDPKLITLNDILMKFFERHDPTQFNRQGNDVGTQYRSGIYYTTNEQKIIAEKYITNEQLKYSSPIVTELKSTEGYTFWMAEDYHQRYLEKGGQNSKKNATESIRCYG
mmetsp:Transcript_37011/g.37666  ORF Transcript_37011/g.37666 Transcript_37011/m.37666 type:complete len:345 (-) Transcript_37011:57-1091(-)